MREHLETVTNRIVSGSATIIAIVALATAVYQAKLSREQAKAAVWPYLIQGRSSTPDGYSWIVQNLGLGPAIVGSLEVLVDGTPMKSWTDVRQALNLPPWHNERATSVRAGFVIPTGGPIGLILLTDSADISAFQAAAADRVETRVCYCSLYNDCWQIRSHEGYKPRLAKACTDDPVTRFGK